MAAALRFQPFLLIMLSGQHPVSLSASSISNAVLAVTVIPKSKPNIDIALWFLPAQLPKASQITVVVFTPAVSSIPTINRFISRSFKISVSSIVALLRQVNKTRAANTVNSQAGLQLLNGKNLVVVSTASALVQRRLARLLTASVVIGTAARSVQTQLVRIVFASGSPLLGAIRAFGVSLVPGLIASTAIIRKQIAPRFSVVSNSAAVSIKQISKPFSVISTATATMIGIHASPVVLAAANVVSTATRALQTALSRSATSTTSAILRLPITQHILSLISVSSAALTQRAAVLSRAAVSNASAQINILIPFALSLIASPVDATANIIRRIARTLTTSSSSIAALMRQQPYLFQTGVLSAGQIIKHVGLGLSAMVFSQGYLQTTLHRVVQFAAHLVSSVATLRVPLFVPITFVIQSIASIGDLVQLVLSPFKPPLQPRLIFSQATLDTSIIFDARLGGPMPYPMQQSPYPIATTADSGKVLGFPLRQSDGSSNDFTGATATLQLRDENDTLYSRVINFNDLTVQWEYVLRPGDFPVSRMWAMAAVSFPNGTGPIYSSEVIFDMIAPD